MGESSGVSRPRIVSLLPSATEIVAALGLGPYLVGRSHECDFPESVAALPACSRAKVNTGAGSAAIDTEVKSLLEKGLSLYEIDLDKLKELKPTHIITQAQCEVCAVTVNEVEQAAQGLLPSQPKVISLAPKRFADLWADMAQVAQAFNAMDEAKPIIKEFKLRCVSVIEKACLVKTRPKVACIEWLEPLMAAGNWVPEMVDLAGGVSLFGEAGKHSPWINWSVVQEHDPEIILVMPCGFDLERTRAEVNALIKQPHWNDLQAVKNGKVFMIDGNSYFNRPGPRLVDSLEMLAELLHPDLFEAKYEGQGWERFVV
jgi:iron complex transport system substrate-binding protein